MDGRQIAERRKQLGWSQTEFAARLGLSRGAVALWETGRGQPNPRHTQEVAELLGIRDVPPPVAVAYPLRPGVSVPVYRAVAVDSASRPFDFRVTAEVVDMVELGMRLRNKRGLRLFRVPVSSMEPRYFVGEQIIVDDTHPPRETDHVVIVRQANGDANGAATETLGRLIRMTDKTVEIEQYSPRKTYSIPRKDVAEILRVLPTSELF